MNTARKCLFPAIASLLLAACATTDSAGLAGKATIHPDADYMAAVEQKARPAGVRVVWVNPPQQRDDD